MPILFEHRGLVQQDADLGQSPIQLDDLLALQVIHYYQSRNQTGDFPEQGFYPVGLDHRLNALHLLEGYRLGFHLLDDL